MKTEPIYGIGIPDGLSYTVVETFKDKLELDRAYEQRSDNSAFKMIRIYNENVTNGPVFIWCGLDDIVEE